MQIVNYCVIHGWVLAIVYSVLLLLDANSVLMQIARLDANSVLMQIVHYCNSVLMQIVY